MAWAEVSTGEVEVTTLDRAEIGPALAALRPSELLTPDRLFADEVVAPALKAFTGYLQPLPAALGDPAAAEARLKRLYRVETLDGFGDFSPAEISALGLIAAHLETTQAGKLPALNPPRRGGASRSPHHRPRHPRQPGDRALASPAPAKARSSPASIAP